MCAPPVPAYFLGVAPRGYVYCTTHILFVGYPFRVFFESPSICQLNSIRGCIHQLSRTVFFYFSLSNIVPLTASWLLQDCLLTSFGSIRQLPRRSRHRPPSPIDRRQSPEIPDRAAVMPTDLSCAVPFKAFSLAPTLLYNSCCNQYSQCFSLLTRALPLQNLRIHKSERIHIHTHHARTRTRDHPHTRSWNRPTSCSLLPRIVCAHDKGVSPVRPVRKSVTNRNLHAPIARASRSLVYGSTPIACPRKR